MYLGEGTSVATPVRVGTVAYEAERLDRLFPGWYLHIDTSTLKMADAELCILGQGVPGVYYFVSSAVVWRDAGYHAYDAPTSLVEKYVWDRHIPEWTAEIERRRAHM